MKKVTEKIVERIFKERSVSNIQDLVEGKVKPTELQPLLLKVYETFAKKIRAIDLIKYYNNRFTNPCDIDQKEIVNFDSIILNSVPEKFSSIEIAPVLPLGSNSSLSKISQKNVLSAVRNVEVVADATIALSLECATRRAKLLQLNPRSVKDVNLCTSHRCIRLQQFSKKLGFTPHFKLFAVCTAGRDIGNMEFELEKIKEHIQLYISVLEQSKSSTYDANNVTVSFSDIQIAENIIVNQDIGKDNIKHLTQARNFDLFDFGSIMLPSRTDKIDSILITAGEKYFSKQLINSLFQTQKRILEDLKSCHPQVVFNFDLSRIAGIGYYTGLCFKITAKNKNGLEFPLVDGGFTDWTQKLLGNKKERLLTSGFGSELFCRNFKK